MTESIEKYFSKSSATDYDEQRRGLAPIKEALHLAMLGFLSRLKEDAHLLCVGAGTGQELLFLARKFPSWQFTVVEPAADMLDICKSKAKSEGFDSRCTFHEGYVDSLPKSARYDGATAILVSQFIVEKQQRIEFFADISSRLVSGALVINAELASDMSSGENEQLAGAWLSMHKDAVLNTSTEPFGKTVSVLSQGDIQEVLKLGGLNEPVLFFQTLLIHAWCSGVE